jgi:beta-ribofuranosylaminobenzene 5'-phosphate synthase
MEAFSAQSKGMSKAGPRQARVTATARLHFGFLDPSGRGEPPFGSFGLSLDRPKTRLVLQPARSFQASGPIEREQALHYLKSMAQGVGIEAAYKLHVEEAIPPHAGLGSGTQLALAVGSAFVALEGLSLDPAEVARRLGRGARSGIGIATFAQGGAVLDSGPRDGRLPELVGRMPFPAEWRVLLIFDRESSGLAGPNETAAFDALPDFPESKSAELRRRIAESALPALAARDFARFCADVGFLQACMGAYFAPLQGGPYTSPRVSEILAWLGAQGVTGLGQSSWGPTGFAFFASESDGEAVVAEAQARARHGGLNFELARGRNEGAKIETSSSEIR